MRPVLLPMRPVLLQLCDLMAPIQEELDRDYEVVRLPGDRADGDGLRAGDAPRIEGVVTGGHVGIATSLADRLPALRIVAINGVGHDRVDLAAMAARGVQVANTPDVLTDDVADLAIALMLNVMRRLPAAERHVREGRWPQGNLPLARRASGLRYGIVGYGRIGMAIAHRLAGFGGHVAYTGRSRKPVPHVFHDRLVDLAAASDVLFIAAAASSETARMVDRAVLDALGPRGVLINVARGSLIDEAALVEALVEDRIWGAGLDVFDAEPSVPDVLLDRPNVALTPHLGSGTHETRVAMGRLMLANLGASFGGKPLPTPVI